MSNKKNEEKEIKNVVFYTRVSSKEQVENFSLENQEKEIREYCKKEKYNIIAKFTDEGITGASVDKRTGLKAMLKKVVEDESIDAIVIWKLSRISRNTKDLLEIIEVLSRNSKKTEKQCALISIKDGINTKNAMSKILIKFLGIFAEMERESIIAQVTSGMRERAREGLVNGGPTPFGYTRNSEKHLVIFEEEAQVVKKIFSMYINEKVGYEAIAKYLSKQNIKTKKGKLFDKQSVKYVIDNPIYAGLVRWGKKGEEDEILARGQHEQIISEETWQRAQKRRKDTSFKPVKKYNHNYLLSGLIKCPYCGSVMIGYPNGKYKYYACSKWNNNKMECGSHLLKGRLIEDEVIEKLSFLVENKKITEGLKNQYNNETGDIEKFEKRIKELEKEINKYQKRKKQAIEMRLDEEISRDEFLKIKEELETNINKINAEKIEINKKIELIKTREITTTQINEYLNDFVGIFKKSKDNKNKKALLNLLIKEIHVKKSDDINKRTIDKIVFKFSLNKSDWVNNGTMNRITSK